MNDIKKSLDVENIYDLVRKKLMAGMKLIILQNNKLENIKDMDQNSLKMMNICMLMKIL